MTDKSNTPTDHKDLWQTPPEIFQALNAEFNFTLDAAASSENSLCRHYITAEQDTLITEWKEAIPSFPGYAWMNPPYSNPMPFIKKANHESEVNNIGCVMLLPADTSVGWFAEAVNYASEVRLITGGRLAFISSQTGKPVSGNNKGSLIIIWHPWPTGSCQFSTVERDQLMSFGSRLIGRAA